MLESRSARPVWPFLAVCAGLAPVTAGAVEPLFDDFEDGDLFDNWSPVDEGWSLVDGTACEDGAGLPLQSRLTYALGDDVFASVAIADTNLAEVAGGGIALGPLGYVSDDLSIQIAYAAVLVNEGDGSLTADIQQVWLDSNQGIDERTIVSFPLDQVPARFGLEMDADRLYLWVDGEILGSAPRVQLEASFTTGHVIVANAYDYAMSTCFDDVVVSPALQVACPTRTARNHGEYVSCIARQTQTWVDAGIVSAQARAEIVRVAAASNIGKKAH